MNRQDRKKQQKKMERQKRLRREKHLQQSRPHRQPTVAAEGHDETPVANPSLRGALPSGANPEERGITRIDPDQPLDNFFKGPAASAWLDALMAGTDMNPIVRAFDAVTLVLPPGWMLKASLCCEILAAAELVAAGIGRPSPHMPPAVALWLIERDTTFTPGVVMFAERAVRRVSENSELRHLWDVVHMAPQWLRGVEALRARLSQGLQ